MFNDVITIFDIIALKLNNKNAFKKVFFLYINKLAAFIDGYVHDKEVSSDIAMESIVKFMENIVNYNPLKASVATYLFTIGKNKALNYLKYKRRFISYDDEKNYFRDKKILV